VSSRVLAAEHIVNPESPILQAETSPKMRKADRPTLAAVAGM